MCKYLHIFMSTLLQTRTDLNNQWPEIAPFLPPPSILQLSCRDCTVGKAAVFVRCQKPVTACSNMSDVSGDDCRLRCSLAANVSQVNNAWSLINRLFIWPPQGHSSCSPSSTHLFPILQQPSFLLECERNSPNLGLSVMNLLPSCK